MSNDSRSGSDARVSGQPPAMFIAELAVPEAISQTAIAITHASRMTKVAVKFHLTAMEDRVARYAASCPRCHNGVIEAFATIAAGGEFAEPPATPALCEACEDQLDAILEGRAPGKPSYADEHRVTLKKFSRPIKRS